MKIELTEKEMDEIIGEALRQHLGQLAKGRKFSDVERKSYPERHYIITMEAEVLDEVPMRVSPSPQFAD